MMKKNMLFLTLIVASFVSARVQFQSHVMLHKNHKETNPALIEPQFPSYIYQGEQGCGLKASCDLEAGAIVGTNDCTLTDKEYIAGHESVEHRHVMVIGVKQDGSPIFGRAWGKGAYTNHSCDPNCDSVDGNIITNRAVKKDEELTTSYDKYVPGLTWHAQWNFKCYCNAINCRLCIDSFKRFKTY